ncbi:hypothetical protein HN652_00940 [archaeon]|jgi:nonsense-mediated mRNA decay protein 3|nr:hypothetical protein [archaeon]MBT6868943.1 hypothetical protein [archaeon]MBT7192836.1 hypothetical protein [archaeon]MBT7380802.1 hypothetical protein [archaeon]MBT7507557.1 hypothetical protein [archaeon]
MVRSLEGKHPNYYEAKLQLRNPNQEIVNYVEKELSKVNMPVTKVEEVKNGFDYYIADNQFSNGLGKRLQSRFGGLLIVTSSLFSRKDGKEIYRTTILFRKTPFNKNDIVMYGGEEYKVVRMLKQIHLLGVKTKKKERIRFTDMNMIKVKED